VDALGERRIGDLDFGPAARVDYDDLVLDFMDHHLRGVHNEFSTAAPVRYFMMGANVWREENQWPPADTHPFELHFGVSPTGLGLLAPVPATGAPASTFVANPNAPVTDPYGEPGPHDYASLRNRGDVLTFETEPFAQDLQVAGAIVADISVSCDCRDFDLWVRVLDVRPDGRSYNLMGPGNDVLRASYRNPSQGRQSLEPGRIYRLELRNLLTSTVLLRGHRLQAQVSASFAPHLSRNLQTGESEVSSAEARVARITVHHAGGSPSTLTLPVQSMARRPSPGPAAGRSLPSTSSNPPATTSLARSKLPSRSR
jgi:putative CocE/NonD family hydrolase